MNLVLDTQRLKLRQLSETDFVYFHEVYSDEETSRFIGGIKSLEDSWRIMASYLGHWQLKGYGYYAVEEKSTGSFIGCAGLWKSPSWPELELGYWFRKEKQGHGYATEATLRVKQIAFENIGADTLVSYIDPDNIASKRLAERIGGVKEKVIELLDFGPHEVYRYQSK